MGGGAATLILYMRWGLHLHIACILQTGGRCNEAMDIIVPVLVFVYYPWKAAPN